MYEISPFLAEKGATMGKQSALNVLYRCLGSRALLGKNIGGGYGKGQAARIQASRTNCMSTQKHIAKRECDAKDLEYGQGGKVLTAATTNIEQLDITPSHTLVFARDAIAEPLVTATTQTPLSINHPCVCKIRQSKRRQAGEYELYP